LQNKDLNHIAISKQVAEAQSFKYKDETVLLNIICTEISSRSTLLQGSTHSLNSTVVEVAYRKGNEVFFLSVEVFEDD